MNSNMIEYIFVLQDIHLHRYIKVFGYLHVHKYI